MPPDLATRRALQPLVKICFTAPPTIATSLCNQAIQTHSFKFVGVGKGPPQCTCQRWRPLQPAAAHFSSRLSDMQGIAGQVGAISAKWVPAPSRSSACISLIRSCLRFLDNIDLVNEVDGFLCSFSQQTRLDEHGCMTEPAPISQDDIARTKILLNGLVICALDKNPNSLWVECPVLTYGRMEKEVVQAPCFTPCDRKPEDLLDEYFQLYISRNLKRFGKLTQKLARLYSALIFPKDKAPIEKSRLVCNRRRPPWRYVLRNLGHILTFVVLEFSKHCMNFNLNDLPKVQELLHRAMARFRAQDGTAHLFAYQCDVKQMFTWLSKQSVLQSVMFALRFIQTYGRSDGRSCSRVEAFQVSKKPWSVAGRAPKHRVGNKTSTARDDFYFFTFQYVIALVQLDLDHAHFTMGNGVFMQLHGCPIGGYVSAQLAVLKCMVDEHTNLTVYIPRPLRKSFFGIRQVDDLLLLVTLPPCHPVVHRLLTAIRNLGQPQQREQFYTGGLELEEETTVTKGLYHFLVFAGYDIALPTTVDMDFQSQPTFKNWNHMMYDNLIRFPQLPPPDDLMYDNLIRFPRLPPPDDFTRRDVRVGTLIGMFTLFASQSSARCHLVEALPQHQLLELRAVSTVTTVLNRAAPLKKLAETSQAFE
eukprot:g5337.t1